MQQNEPTPLGAAKRTLEEETQENNLSSARFAEEYALHKPRFNAVCAELTRLYESTYDIQRESKRLENRLDALRALERKHVSTHAKLAEEYKGKNALLAEGKIAQTDYDAFWLQTALSQVELGEAVVKSHVDLLECDDAFRALHKKHAEISLKLCETFQEKRRVALELIKNRQGCNETNRRQVELVRKHIEISKAQNANE